MLLYDKQSTHSLGKDRIIYLLSSIVFHLVHLMLGILIFVVSSECRNIVHVFVNTFPDPSLAPEKPK